MGRSLSKLGDYFAIPLPDGRIGYGQYVYCHGLMASLVRVSALITDEEADLPTISQAGDLFPPVFVGINVPLRQKIWRVVGHADVSNFQLPLFRCRQGLEREPGKYSDWLIWDGCDYKFIGELPPEQRRLEYLLGWSSDSLEQRIATGVNEPYDSMI